MTIYNTSFGADQVLSKMTFLFGVIIVGNVVDNVSHPKWVALFLQITLGVSWCLTGGIVNKAAAFAKIPPSYKGAVDVNFNLSQLMGSGIVIISIL